MTESAAPFLIFASMNPKVALKARFQHRRAIDDAISNFNSSAQALLIISKANQPSEDGRYVVLTFTSTDPVTPFATHLCEIDGDRAAFFWGHYFNSLDEAFKDAQGR